MFDRRRGHNISRGRDLAKCLIGGGVIVFLGGVVLISVDRRRAIVFLGEWSC